MSRGGETEIDLAVEDDGIGWDGNGKPQGTGLGSRIVKAMAHSLGATVSYRTEGHGTKVTVQFLA
ncbi:Histidine kinase-, DNA gyrase B-, and HSP90-like ATPase [compost metagenome]